MDLLRLPPSLRRILFINQSWRRPLSTITQSEPLQTDAPNDNLTRNFYDYEPEPLDLSKLEVPERLGPEDYNTYQQTLPPTEVQRKFANWFFASTTKRSADRGPASPLFLFSTPTFRQFPQSSLPEVAFVGRQNAGKSSLLNALMFGKSDNATSSDPNGARVSVIKGRTKTMNAYGVLAPGKTLGAASRRKFPVHADEVGEDWKRFPTGNSLVLVDTPGYPRDFNLNLDRVSRGVVKKIMEKWKPFNPRRPREEWKTIHPEIIKYLTKRKQLKKVYVLVESRSPDSIPDNDWIMMRELRLAGVPYQVVMTKADNYLAPHAKKAPKTHKFKAYLGSLKRDQAELIKKIDQYAGDGRTGLTDILCVSAHKGLDYRHYKNLNRLLGIDELRWSVLSACGFECDEKGQPMKRSMEDITILD